MKKSTAVIGRVTLVNIPSILNAGYILYIPSAITVQVFHRIKHFIFITYRISEANYCHTNAKLLDCF